MQRIYVHPLPVRIWHWINALGFVALIVTGVQIRYADMVGLMSFKNAVHLHNWTGFVLVANFFVWLLFYLFGYFDIDFPKGLGFLGISVALLARNHPVGVIPAALLFGFLDRGAQGVQVFADVPREVITILQAIIILAIVVAYELLTRYVRVQRKREAERLVMTAVPAPAGEGG